MEQTISRRKLRNQHKAIMRAVKRGESFVITHHGIPIGCLTPIAGRMFIPIDGIREAFAHSARIDYEQFRADIDAHIDQSISLRC